MIARGEDDMSATDDRGGECGGGIPREDLAFDRTVLANERTLLAYLRSAIALIIAGVSMIHFSKEGWFWAVGIACLPTGAVTGILGVIRYRRMNDSILCRRRRPRRTADR